MTMTASKPPTTRGISALLRDAGFTKAGRSPSRVRGLSGGMLPGYEVKALDESSVRVDESTGNLAVIARYAEVLAAAGYQVAPGALGRLIVTRPGTTTPKGEDR